MNNLLRQYKFHKIIDYGTIVAGFSAIALAQYLDANDDSIFSGFFVFFYFYFVRSTLSLAHYGCSRSFFKNIKSSPKLLDKKIAQYPSFITTRSIFRLVNIAILLFMVFGTSWSFFDGLFYANMAVIPLCVIERLYLEKVAKFDVSGEYLIKMNEARFSGVDMPRSDDSRSGFRCDSQDPGNPSSITYSTNYYSSRNNNFH